MTVRDHWPSWDRRCRQPRVGQTRVHIVGPMDMHGWRRCQRCDSVVSLDPHLGPELGMGPHRPGTLVLETVTELLMDYSYASVEREISTVEMVSGLHPMCRHDASWTTW